MQIQADRTDTASPVELQLNKNGGVVGASPVVAVRDGATMNSWLDFADLTFKTGGWTTRQAALTEVSAANAPGIYVLAGGLNLEGITNLPTATDHLILEFESAPPAKGNAIDVILLTQSGVADFMSLYDHRVWIDTTGGGTAGTELGVNGTEANPVDNLADGLTIAAALGVRTIDLCGAVTLTAAFNNFRVIGSCAEPARSRVSVAGQDISDSVFTSCALDGDLGLGSAPAKFFDCIIGQLGLTTNVRGLYIRCRFGGFDPIQLRQGGATQMIQCHASAGGGTASAPAMFDFVLAGAFATFVATDFHGEIELLNMDQASDSATITMVGDQILIGPTNTDGSVKVAGVSIVNDNSGGAVDINQDSLVLQSEIGEILDWLKNRRRIDFAVGPPRQLVLFERDGVTEKFRMNLTTENGTEVLAFFAVQHERGVPV